MSGHVYTSGEIIESINFLSNKFVTLTSDQIIYGTKTIDTLLFDDLHGNNGFHNVSTISLNDNSDNSILNTNGLQINASNYSSSFNNEIKLFESVNLNNSFTNLEVLLKTSGLYFSNNAQINASILDISSTNLKLNGNSGISGQVITSNGSGPPTWETKPYVFGSTQIDPTLNRGTIYFGKTFSSIPFVIISQLSPNRIIPICITGINVSSFNWAAISYDVGIITWNAGIN